MPSLYKVFSAIDSNECRRHLVQPNPSPLSSISFDQMALVAKSVEATFLLSSWC
ncbi:hypothetical protein CsSME_00011254 [Camellia sinensis var. sinensis]